MSPPGISFFYFKFFKARKDSVDNRPQSTIATSIGAYTEQQASSFFFWIIYYINIQSM